MKNKSKQLLVLLFVSIFTILFSWYRNINREEYYTNEDKVKISNASSVIKNYNNKKHYYRINKTEMYKKRSMIPFIYNKTIIKENNPEYISENCGC